MPVNHKSIVVDVQIVEGIIITDAKVNGVTGKYIVDSGAPGLVLNSNRETARKADCISVHQKFTCGQKKVRAFEWNHIRKKRLTALVTDLSFLESVVGFKIHGLIGFNLINKQKLFINFSRNEIIFLPKKSSDAEIAFKAFANFVVPFKMEGNIPVIDYNMNGRIVRLGIDSGAKSNILDKSILTSQSEDMILSKVPIEVIGTDLFVARSESIMIYNEDAPNPFLTMNEFVMYDLSHLNQSGYKLDGLVGPSFFNDCLLLFDFKEKKVYAGFTR